MLLKDYPMSAKQFGLFRITLALYFLQHYLLLLPYAVEIYSNKGVLPDANLNPTFNIFPSVFWISDSPQAVLMVLNMLILLSVTFGVGLFRKISAFGLWYFSACLFNRNILTSNPSLHFIGLILILTLLVPSTERYSFGAFCKRTNSKECDWFFPRNVLICAWVTMALGYTFSGIIKLSSPSWVDGTALIHLFNNPLARPGFIREWILSFPEILLKCLTWFALILEIIFLPLSFFRWGRVVAWFSMLGLHLGILCGVAFADLTFGMLMLHFFTFEPRWLLIFKQR